MIIDRLYEDVKSKGCVCVGLDTDIEYIPDTLKNEYKALGDVIFQFNKRIIDATHDIVACYKVQIAYYESMGIEGLIAYKKTLDYIKNKNVISVADIKRGDIAKTAEMYAKAHFHGDFEADFITLNPYMGMDSIEPYLQYVKDKNKGLFALMRTSNKGAEDIEYIETKDSNRVYDVVGDKIQNIADDFKGNCGYSSVGVVVGCTHRDEGIKIRKKHSSMFFLIPGYGAQGGKAEDVALYLENGNGGVVNSSRGVLLAYKKVQDGDKKFELCAREEVLRMREEINNAVKVREKECSK